MRLIRVAFQLFILPAGLLLLAHAATASEAPLRKHWV